MAAGRRSPPGPCCPSRVAVPSVHQSLPEMDFERGIWAAARDGDEPRVLELLERRGEPSQPDLAGTMPAAMATWASAGCCCSAVPAATPARRVVPPLCTVPATAATCPSPSCCWPTAPTRWPPTGTATPACTRPLSKATGSSAPCCCGTARRWLASATPRDGVPVMWPPRRCGTCWTPDGDTWCHWTTSVMDKQSPWHRMASSSLCPLHQGHPVPVRSVTMREPKFCSHPAEQLGTLRRRQKGFSRSQWDGLVAPVAEERAGLSAW